MATRERFDVAPMATSSSLRSSFRFGHRGTRIRNRELASQREWPALQEAEDRHDAQPGSLSVVCQRQHAFAKIHACIRHDALNFLDNGPLRRRGVGEVAGRDVKRQFGNDRRGVGRKCAQVRLKTSDTVLVISREVIDFSEGFIGHSVDGLLEGKHSGSETSALIRRTVVGHPLSDQTLLFPRTSNGIRRWFARPGPDERGDQHGTVGAPPEEHLARGHGRALRRIAVGRAR